MSVVTATSGIDGPDGVPLPLTPPPAPRRRAAAVRARPLVLRKIFDRPDGSAWNSGLALQDHLVVVRRRVDRRDLAGAEGVEQLLPDLVDRDAVDRRLLAIDLDRHLRILDVEVGVDVAQAVDLGDLVAHLRRDAIERCRCRSTAACTGIRSWRCGR